MQNVAADDVLNIRAEPTTTSEIVGALTPDAEQIEVVRAQGGWGLVNTGERSGWIYMKFVSPSAEQPSHAYPPACSGTEPFWGLSNGDDVTFNVIGEPDLSATRVESLTAVGRVGKYMTHAESDTVKLTTVITRLACNDGMSDRNFGLSVDLIVETSEGRRLFTGCCALR